MEKLQRLVPNVADPLRELPLVVEGCKVLIRRGEELSEPGGQLLIDFDATDDGIDDEMSVAIPIGTTKVVDQPTADDLRELAADLDARDDRAQAIEVMRSVAMSGAGTAEDQFTLGELLYRSGDLPAARERYFMAVERDEDFVEARVNLGCVLAELDVPHLAEAAFRGALAHHPDYTDAHYHLAQLLESLGRSDAAHEL